MGATSTLSRRTSEFAGVALFGASLIWLIALVTYEPGDPVWFFTVGADARPPTSSAWSARLSPRCRSSCSATPRFSSRRFSACWAGTTSGAAPWMPATPSRSARRCLSAAWRRCSASCSATPRSAGRTFRAGGYIGRVDRRRLHRLPQSARLGHRHAHAAGARRDPDDAVLVRPVVHGRLRGGRGRRRARVGGVCARGARSAARRRSAAR